MFTYSIQSFKILASFCNCADRFVCYLVRNQEDWFTRSVAYLELEEALDKELQIWLCWVGVQACV